jgi:hypothetical protein
MLCQPDIQVISSLRMHMKNGPKPVFPFLRSVAVQLAGCGVAAAVTVAVDATARFIGVADQRASDTTHRSTNGRTTNITCCHAADDGTGSGTDAGTLFRLGASGERKDENGCEENLFHDGFLFKAVMDKCPWASAVTYQRIRFDPSAQG